MLDTIERIPKLGYRRVYRKPYHRRPFKAMPNRASLAVYAEAEEGLFCDKCATYIQVGTGYCISSSDETLCLKCALRKEG